MATVAGGLVLMLVVVGIVFLFGMRAKARPVIDTVRRFNRAFTNPRVLKSAGTAGASASVVRHAGRTTGRRYETPIGAMPTDTGFLIALPYGTRADWLENVLAAGSATIVDGGNTYEVHAPEVVPTAAVADQLPPGERRTLRLFKVDHCLQVRTTEPAGDIVAQRGDGEPPR
jgi:deazaflavin-dependent oxidoreductase (nitroreductase family)